MIMCIRRWHTQTYLKLLKPDKIVLLQTHSLQSLVLLIVSAHPLISVCAITHTCTCAHTADPGSTRQSWADLWWPHCWTWFTGLCLTVWVFSWLDQLYLPSHDLSYGEKDDFSANATRAGQAAVSKEDTWDTTLSCDLLAGFGMIKLERSQLSTPHPHSLLWSTNLMQIIWEHSCFFGGEYTQTHTQQVKMTFANGILLPSTVFPIGHSCHLPSPPFPVLLLSLPLQPSILLLDYYSCTDCKMYYFVLYWKKDL